MKNSMTNLSEEELARVVRDTLAGRAKDMLGGNVTLSVPDLKKAQYEVTHSKVAYGLGTIKVTIEFKNPTGNGLYATGDLRVGMKVKWTDRHGPGSGVVHSFNRNGKPVVASERDGKRYIFHNPAILKVVA